MIEDSTLTWIRDQLLSGTPTYPNEPCPYPTLSQPDLRVAESRLGFRIPPSLRGIYTEIGNGWHIRGSQLIGLIGGNLTEHDYDAVTDYLEQINNMSWFKNQLLIADLGCCLYLYLDCNTADGPIYLFDGNFFDPESESDRNTPKSEFWRREADNLISWLIASLTRK